MAKQYDADEYSLDALFTKYTDIYVPPFQRPYKWGEEQIEELFEDLFKGLDWTKGVRSLSERGEGHYLGAVVLCKDGARHMVLDGQQRLTTLSLILAYVKGKMFAGSNGDVQKQRKAIEIEGLLFQKKAGGGEKTVKLAPQEDDLAVFHQVVESEQESIQLENDPAGATSAQKKSRRLLRKRPIFKAYKYIRELIKKHVVVPATSAGIDEFNALDLAATRIQNSISLVVIEAHNESAAFRLFETLNARGLDLSAADLIKNSLFALAKTDQERKCVRDSWEDIAESVNGDLVAFLRTFWLTDHKFVRKDGLFDAYKAELAENRHNDSFLRKFLESVSKAADHFAELTSPEETSDNYEGIQALNDLGAKTCRPLLLVIKINRPELLLKVIPLIESLTVRWMIAGKVFNSLETAYADISVEISELIKGQKSDDEILDHISRRLKSLDVPDDETFALNFEKYEVTRTSKAVRHILCKLNFALSGDNKEQVASPKSVHIEHIFPQDPSDEALAHSEITEEESEDYSSKIGNITLLAAKINMGIKNKSFPQKKAAENGIKQSRLAINDYVIKCTHWRKKEIDDRSKQFAEIAVDVWPW